MDLADIFCLNPKYSTTRIVTKKQPRIENDPSSKLQTQLFLPDHPERQGEGGLRTNGYFKKSFNGKPLISIITVVFNGHEHIEQTIHSVISQTYDNLEYIIIDGGSTDGTLDIIRRYDHAVDYWVSEPDKGLYDAMNKGWSVARDSSFLLFLGAGDEILELPLEIPKFRNCDVIFGKVDLGEGKFFNSKADIRLRLGNTLHHQALLINKSLSSEPPFNTKYKIYADFDFNQRLLKQGVKFIHSSNFVSYAMPGGASKQLLINESVSIVMKNFGVFWAMVAILYYLYQGVKFGFNTLSIR